MSDKNERLKAYLVPWESLRQILTPANRAHGGIVILPTNKEIPIDSEVIAVYAEPMTRSWRIIVAHESFDAVPHGQMIPTVESQDMIVKRFWLSEEPLEPLEAAGDSHGDNPLTWGDVTDILDGMNEVMA